MADFTLTSEWVGQLLRTPTLAEQTTLLQAADLLNPAGLSALLDNAERLLTGDPNQAEQVVALCEQLAARTAAPAIFPQAAYWRGMTYAARGELQLAQTLIEMARAGYASLGMPGEAVRTNVGLQLVLGEGGQFEQALAVGQKALQQIGSTDPADADRETAEQALLAAKIYQNSGLCYDFTGRYDEALAAYAAASVRYQRLGLPEATAQVLENRAIVLMFLGQVQAALLVFEDARRLYAQEKLPLAEAQSLVNIGEARLLLSDFVQSLQAFEAAEQLFSPLGVLFEHPTVLRQIGDVYLALNLYGEALDAYRKAKADLPANFVYHSGYIDWGMGMALAAQAQFAEAQQALTSAAQSFQTLNNTPVLAAIQLEQAALYELLGETSAARALAQNALDLVVDSNWVVQKIYAYLRNADLRLPNTAEVEPLLLAAEPLVNTLNLPPLRYRLQQRLGHLRLLQGDDAAAQAHLERAVDEIEGLRSTLAQERMRASFLTDKITAYQDLVQLYLNRGDVEQAFNLAERAKSRALVDLLAGVIQTQLDQPADQVDAEQLQKLQADLNAIYNEMLTGNNDESVRTADFSILQKRAVEVEQAISRLRLHPASAPMSERSLPGQAFPVEAIWQTLEADQALVVYHIVDNEIMAFVCVNQQMHLHRQLSAVAEVQPILRRLAAQWDRVRLGQPLFTRHLAQLQQSTQRLLHTLYLQLMTPVWSQLEVVAPLAAGTIRKLVIAPHALLHQTPFHALHTGEQYLLERCAISYAPSATVFALCQQRTLRRSGVALAVGVADERIPAVVQEVQRVAQRLRQDKRTVQTLIGAKATVAALTHHAAHCRLLHLACHGLFRGDNPMFSALKLHDGWLTAADVAQFDLAGALVTLSACESGRSQVIGGDEILGLTYAFLSAGAATLLVSQWLVQDQVTAELMDHWYKLLAETGDLAEALRRAQLTIMQQHPHPYYWAPFLLVGQRISGLK